MSLMNLIHVWHDDWSKILLGTIPTPVHDLKVKVTDLENSYVNFLQSNFCKAFDGFDSYLP